MENSIALKRSIDDLIFEGRNQAYGAFMLRRLYDKHMTRAMIIAFLFFLLAMSTPQIISMIRGFLPAANEEFVNTGVILSEPPPIEATKLPRPARARAELPPIKPQIKFLPPAVVPDETELKEDLPPTTQNITGNIIGSRTAKGAEGGEDPTLADDPPSAEPILQEPEADMPFTYVEQMPSFPDGIEAMYKYIYRMIKYPVIAREIGISGPVTIQFVVSKEGEIQDAKVIRGLGGGINEEALRVINGMPRWIPGKHNGKTVPVTFTLPIKFVLK